MSVVMHVSEEKSEAVELKEVLDAVSGFLKGLKEPLMDIINTILDSLSGEKLGVEVASFYKRLVDSGVPENLAAEMTKEYMEKRLNAVPSLGSLLESFGGMGARMRSGAPHKEGLDKTIQLLERLKEEYPEKREKIEKALEKLRRLEGLEEQGGEEE